MNKYFYPIYKMKIPPWIKYWLLKKTSGSKVLSELIEGTSPITIENVYKGTSLQELVFKGQTIQDGTPTPEAPIEVETVSGDNNIVVSNKNLFDSNYNDYDLSGLYGYIKVTEENTDYVISLIEKDSSITLSGIYFGWTKNGFNASAGLNWIINNGNLVSTSQINKQGQIYLGCISFYPKNETTFNKIISKYDIQIEKGTVATEYTEHKGSSYRVDLGGKNSFYDTLRQGVTQYNTGTYGTNNYRITSTDWITKVQAGTYTINANTSTTKTLQVSMVTFDTNGNFYNVSGVSGQWKTMPFTFTIPVDMQLKCNIRYSNDSAITPSEVTEVQLESGNVATPFSPYTDNPIELCKIGNYQDKLYYESGKWYLHKEVGKVILNGTETWSGTPNYYTSIIQNLIAPTPATERIIALSNNFLVQGYDFKSSNNLYFQTNKNLQIENPNASYYATVNDWKTWLSTHNTTVYYVLATPTYIEITDTNLINQLETIKNATLISGTNVITQIPADLPFILNFKYYMKG